MRCAFLLYLFSVLAFSINAQNPKAFYIGHSLSDQIPDMVQSLSDDDPDVSFSWVYQSIPGAPLRWQWDRKDANDLTENPPQFYNFYNPTNGLPAGDYDVLVLTESVPRYLSIIDETYEYADSFFNYATSHNTNLKVFLYEDWHCILSGTPTGCDYDIDSNPWRQRLTDDLPMWESVVDSLNERYQPTSPVCLIPGGQGLARLYDSIQIGAVPNINAIDEIFSDNIHLTEIGKYFIACIHYATIHEKSPVGLTNQLQHWWGGDFDAPSLETAEKLQEIAWATVLEYPNTCVANSTSLNPLKTQDQFLISPNPVTDRLSIKGTIVGQEIEIFDVTGAIKLKEKSRGQGMEISLSKFSDGMYFIRILNEFGEVKFLEKLIKI